MRWRRCSATFANSAKAGDRVTLHLPMTLELPITMLRPVELGVIHSQVFGGFSGQACGTHIRNLYSGSHILISMDAYWRAGKLGDHKVNADIAVETAKEMGQHVDKVLIWAALPRQVTTPTPMVKGRDFIVNEVLKKYQGARVDPVPMDAEAPLFLMYTSGSTGKPKGCQHRTGGYLAYVARHLQIHPGHSSDRHLLVHGGHRLDLPRPLVHRSTHASHHGRTSARIRRGVPTRRRRGATAANRRAPRADTIHTSPTAIRGAEEGWAPRSR